MCLAMTRGATVMAATERGSKVEPGSLAAHETKLYRINNGGHNAPARQKRPEGFIAKRISGTQNRDIETPEEIWAFFKSKRR